MGVFEQILEEEMNIRELKQQIEDLKRKSSYVFERGGLHLDYNTNPKLKRYCRE